MREAAGPFPPTPTLPLQGEGRRRAWPDELALVFWLALPAYLAAGAFLVLHQHSFAIDAYSRVAIAHRMLFSGDPHLAAIGFVWSPLPVLALLPLVPLGSVWPALTTYGFAVCIVSALCMAATAREVAAFLRDMGVGVPGRPLLTLAFAAHPMIVLYAANGMSEAMFLFFLLMATRRLAGWLRTGDLHLATGAALALAAAYLSRYEALAAAGAAVGLAALWAYRRTPGTRRRRLEQAACDAAVFGAPVLVAFVGFALISLAITGSPFEQYTSTYGNSSAVQVSGIAAAGRNWGYATLALTQLLILEPFVLAVAAIAAFRAWRRRRGAATLAVLGLVGGVLAFMLRSTAKGDVRPDLRYMITAIPSAVLAAGAALGAIHADPRRRASIAVSVATVLMVASALPASAGPVRATLAPAPTDTAQGPIWFVSDRRIAADLDAMDLPPGSVLLDDFLGFAIPLNSRNPRQFVITSDRDFQEVLSDPAAAGVAYVLVPEPANVGLLDAVNRQYPDLYASGAGMATLVREYTGSPRWRLYRLRPEPGP